MNKYLLSTILLTISLSYCFGQNYLKLGDDCFDKGDYACAKTNYDQLQEINYTQNVDIKISRTNSCISSLKTANSFYSSKNYQQAEEYYQKILDTNPKDEYAANQIDLCRKYIRISVFGNILDKQKTYQSYLKENLEGFNKYRNENYNSIEKMISELNGTGNVNFTTYIEFDTLGRNLSTLKIRSLSTNRIGTYINESIISEWLPITESGFFIPTIDSIPYDLSWYTYNLNINSRSFKTQIKSTDLSSEDYYFKIRSFISNQKYSEGIFKFEVVEKKLNGKVFNDITLINYRNNNGPLNSAYSLILPGWGTLKVSDGTKGKGRMTLFLFSSLISAGCKIYSNTEYNKFIDSNASNTGEDHYNNANLANQAFLISGGISASIYVYDFIWVFRQGIKNINKSRVYKNNVKENPSIVMESPLKYP